MSVPIDITCPPVLIAAMSIAFQTVPTPGGDQSDDFDRLVGSTDNGARQINTSYGHGKVVDLEGGGTASSRPGLSTGPRAVQINRPDQDARAVG